MPRLACPVFSCVHSFSYVSSLTSLIICQALNDVTFKNEEERKDFRKEPAENWEGLGSIPKWRSWIGGCRDDGGGHVLLLHRLEFSSQHPCCVAPNHL